MEKTLKLRSLNRNHIGQKTPKSERRIDMKLELFMRSIGQEYPDKDLSSENGWTSYNNKSHRQRLYPPSPHEEDTLLRDVRIRAEQGGGLLYDMETKAVFYMDEPALAAVRCLAKGESFATLPTAAGVTNDEVRELREAMVKYGLCSN